jgi:hypothetical protein
MEQDQNQLNQKLSELGEKVGQNETLAKLVADPDIRRILEARQRGEQVSVNVGDEPQQRQSTPDVEDPEDFDMLDNQELANYLMKKMDRVLEEKVNQSIQGISQKVQSLEGYVQENETKSVKQQVAELREKYSDFDQYKDQMVELNRQNPNLTPEDLYFIAKKRSGHFDEPRPKESESEKPTQSVTRPPKPDREEPLPQGKGGFDQMLGEALDDLDLSEFNE